MCLRRNGNDQSTGVFKISFSAVRPDKWHNIQEFVESVLREKESLRWKGFMISTTFKKRIVNIHQIKQVVKIMWHKATLRAHGSFTHIS